MAKVTQVTEPAIIAELHAAQPLELRCYRCLL
jgi:hypothetical protein